MSSFEYEKRQKEKLNQRLLSKYNLKLKTPMYHPQKIEKPIYQTYSQCPIWIIEERVGESDYWNSLSGEYHTYEEAMVVFYTYKMEYPYGHYRIIQIERSIYKKSGVIHTTE